MGKITSAIAGVFKTIVAKAKGVSTEPDKTLRTRDKKTILTKAMKRYVTTKMMPAKLKGTFTSVQSGKLYLYEIILTPNSDMAVASFYFKDSDHYEVQERLTFPRLSDHFVVNNEFDSFYDSIKKALEDK